MKITALAIIVFQLLVFCKFSLADTKFKFINEPKTAAAAQTYCQNQLNGNLVSINSASDNTQVTSLCENLGQTQGACWLGLSNAQTQTTWFDATELSYINWAINEPDQIGIANCVVIWPSGLWHTVGYCDDPLPFICEFPDYDRTFEYPETINPSVGNQIGGIEISPRSDISFSATFTAGILSNKNILFIGNNNNKILLYTYNSPDEIGIGLDFTIDGITTDFTCNNFCEFQRGNCLNTMFNFKVQIRDTSFSISVDGNECGSGLINSITSSGLNGLEAPIYASAPGLDSFNGKGTISNINIKPSIISKSSISSDNYVAVECEDADYSLTSCGIKSININNIATIDGTWYNYIARCNGRKPYSLSSSNIEGIARCTTDIKNVHYYNLGYVPSGSSIKCPNSNEIMLSCLSSVSSYSIISGAYIGIKNVNNPIKYSSCTGINQNSVDPIYIDISCAPKQQNGLTLQCNTKWGIIGEESSIGCNNDEELVGCSGISDGGEIKEYYILNDECKSRFAVGDNGKAVATCCKSQSNEISIDCESTVLSAVYHNRTGNQYSVLDQGRVNGINIWGYDPLGKQFVISEWSVDAQTVPNTISMGTYNQCTSFTLNNNDYIISSKVYYDTDFVYGVIFNTLNGITYSCLSPDYQGKTQAIFAPECSDDNCFYYLSGFNIKHGDVTHGVQFQYTLLCQDDDDNAKSNVENADSMDYMSKSTKLNDGESISPIVMYIIYVIIGLVSIILIVFAVYFCCKARNKYKEINLKSVECEQDIESQQIN
eukprot:199709_1